MTNTPINKSVVLRATQTHQTGQNNEPTTHPLSKNAKKIGRIKKLGALLLTGLSSIKSSARVNNRLNEPSQTRFLTQIETRHAVAKNFFIPSKSPDSLNPAFVNNNDAQFDELDELVIDWQHEWGFNDFVKDRIPVWQNQGPLDLEKLDQEIKDKYELDAFYESLEKTTLPKSVRFKPVELPPIKNNENESKRKKRPYPKTETRKILTSDEIKEKINLLQKNSLSDYNQYKLSAEQAVFHEVRTDEEFAIKSLKKTISKFMKSKPMQAPTPLEVGELLGLPLDVVINPDFPKNLQYSDFCKDNWAENRITIASFFKLNRAKANGSRERWAIIDNAIQTQGRRVANPELEEQNYAQARLEPQENSFEESYLSKINSIDIETEYPEPRYSVIDSMFDNIKTFSNTMRDGIAWFFDVPER